jgi:hypothetical protein
VDRNAEHAGDATATNALQEASGERVRADGKSGFFDGTCATLPRNPTAFAAADETFFSPMHVGGNALRFPIEQGRPDTVAEEVTCLNLSVFLAAPTRCAIVLRDVDEAIPLADAFPKGAQAGAMLIVAHEAAWMR